MTDGGAKLQAAPLGADKAQWRRWAKAVRARARAQAGPAAEQAIWATLRASQPYRDARTVGLYLKMGDEVDLDDLLKDDKRFVAPRSHALPHHHLTFHELAGGALELHRWGMRQPPASQPPVALQQIDVLLVPGLLFDVAGTRLGYGMGYYDRALASGGGPVTVGVTLQALLVPELPRAPHDVAVQYLLTEAGLRRAKPAP